MKTRVQPVTAHMQEELRAPMSNERVKHAAAGQLPVSQKYRSLPRLSNSSTFSISLPPYLPLCLPPYTGQRWLLGREI